MTLGQEFNAFGESLENEITALERVENILYEVNMGGTAIGTGLNAPEGYAAAETGTKTEAPSAAAALRTPTAEKQG